MEIRKTQQTISKYSLWMMITTSIHHIYGAYIYCTPDRLHVLIISVPVILLIFYFDRYFKRFGPTYKTLPMIAFAAMVLIPIVLLIGVLEGIYNHIFKNVLFISGVAEDTIINTYYHFYDPGIVEMPNDALFELTGVLQGFLVVPLGKHFVDLIRHQLAIFSKNEVSRSIKRKINNNKQRKKRCAH